LIAHWRENNQQQLFFEYGARWNVIAEAEFFSTACELVSAGCGVGIVDPVVSAPFAAIVVRRPFVPKINYEIAVLYPTNEELFAARAGFCKPCNSIRGCISALRGGITKSPALDSACTLLLPPHASLLPLLCLWDGAMS
jgi:hypothetical protein